LSVITFFKVGSFSHINAQVEKQLRAHFPDSHVETFDVLDELRVRAPRSHFSLSLLAAARYAKWIGARRLPPKDFITRLVPGWRAVQELARQIIREQPTRFSFQTQSLFDARHPGVPHFIYTDHTYRANEMYRYQKKPYPVSAEWQKLEAELYHGATRTFSTSRFVNQSLARLYKLPLSQMRCVFSGMNLELPATPGNPADNPPVILFVGVEWERKGGPQLLEAFAGVRRKMPEAELWIVGCNPRTSLPGVRIFGRVPLEEVEQFYRKARLFALPSLREPSATVLMEAAGYGLPIVASDVGGSAERVQDCKTGLLTAPGDINGLEEDLLEILSSPQKASEMGRAGRRLVETTFTWDRVGEKLQTFIEEDLSP